MRRLNRAALCELMLRDPVGFDEYCAYRARVAAELRRWRESRRARRVFCRLPMGRRRGEPPCPVRKVAMRPRSDVLLL